MLDICCCVPNLENCSEYDFGLLFPCFSNVELETSSESDLWTICYCCCCLDSVHRLKFEPVGRDKAMELEPPRVDATGILYA
jgi:hypothetical protein